MNIGTGSPANQSDWSVSASTISTPGDSLHPRARIKRPVALSSHPCPCAHNLNHTLTLIGKCSVTTEYFIDEKHVAIRIRHRCYIETNQYETAARKNCRRLFCQLLLPPRATKIQIAQASFVSDDYGFIRRSFKSLALHMMLDGMIHR